MEMKKYKLIAATDYCERVFDGTHATPKQTEVGFKLLTSKNILNGNLDKTDAYFISEEDYNSINKRSQVKQYDILFSMIGSVGNVCMIKDSTVDFAIKNMGVFSCNEKNKALFLYYYLQSPFAKKTIESYLNGAVQKFLGLERLRSFPVPEYSNDKQKIAAVLSALDDKIALNRRLNAKLEQMAKRLYDHWFVQFDFPRSVSAEPCSHELCRTDDGKTRSDFPNENGKPYKASGGKMVWNETLRCEIPEGWEVKKLGDVCKIVLGGTPSTANNEFWENGTINWLNSGEVGIFPIVESEKKITEIAVEKSTTEFLKAGSVTLSITRYLRPSILAIDACINQSVVGIKENVLFKNCFLYPYLQNEIDRLMSLRTGAQQPHINKEIVEESFMIVPPKELMSVYDKRVCPVYAQIINIAKEIQKLTVLRDRLLQLLMNGQVEVR